MVELRPGARFQSAVCATEMIVVKGAGPAELTCGGVPMVPAGSAERTGEPSADASEGTLLGKRYGDPDETVEVLCTKAGEGVSGARRCAAGREGDENRSPPRTDQPRRR